MTSQVVPYDLKIDKLEISLRLGQDNYYALNVIQDIVDLYIKWGEAFYERGNSHRNNERRASFYTIPLLSNRNRKCNLGAELGVATDRNGNRHPYAKFSFNVNRLAANEEARERFKLVLNDLIPPGGYSVLLEESYVLYAEFSADFRGVQAESIDAYCPTLDQSLYFSRNEIIKTINIHDNRRGRPEAFCIYDKKLADREQHSRIRRGPLLRIESKRRFNRTQTYRQLHLEDLHSIPNPFRGLRIYDREQIESTFTAARHTNFLARVRSQGVQAALVGTRGADRDRRERMLDESCRVDWWNPEHTWAGIYNALNAAFEL